MLASKEASRWLLELSALVADADFAAVAVAVAASSAGQAGQALTMASWSQEQASCWPVQEKEE